MRPRLLVSIALVAAVPGLLCAQEPQDHRRTVTIEGCVQKSWLRVFQQDTFGRHTDRYHLHGPKDLMKTLTKDLDGHDVEVTGALSDPEDTQGRGKEIQVGKKTRIYTNARDVPSTPPVLNPTLEVSSFRDVSKTCSVS